MAKSKPAPAETAPEFEFDQEKHIRIGNFVYNKDEMGEAPRAEIGFIHWIDQQIANKNAELKVIEDGRDVAIKRLMGALQDVDHVAEMAPPAEEGKE